ncbi:LysR family transcriptional regulator [Streptomyces sp. NPDC058382]|uniref:LysR family transcriptional regulator n=1 Tax=unclassified Streptomyces TaxID=2593676 RepID=UPI00363EBDD2
MIDPRLQTLRVLAETGTVTATAEALHLTPSTVSQQLRRLADELNVRLLEPQGRRVRLTPAARTLVEHADVLHAQWERAAADLAAHRDNGPGELRITSVATALGTLVVPAMARLLSWHPGMTHYIGEDPEADRFRMLLTRERDIAVVIPAPGTPPSDDERFEQHLLLQEPQDLLVPSGHRFADRDTVELHEAATETWLRAGDPRDQHLLLTSACAAAGFSPRVTHNAVDWSAVAALVAGGHGICLLPRLARIPRNYGLVRVPLRGDVVPTRRLVGFVRRGGGSTPLISDGLRALREAAVSSDPRSATPGGRAARDGADS